MWCDDKMFKIIINNSKFIYNIDSYELIDDNSTIRFFDKVQNEYKRFPYSNVRIVEVQDGWIDFNILSWNYRIT